MAKRLRVLHLSDLHIGKERPENAYRVERVMGAAWDLNLAEIRRDGPVDLVCFTGDLAQSGKPEQYERLKDVIRNVQTRIGCPLDRFFCVPGNHDIDRDVEKSTWRKLRPALANAPHAFSDWFAESLPSKPIPSGRRKPKSRAPTGFKDAARDELLARQQAYRNFLLETGLSHLLPGQAGNPHPRLGYRRALDVGLGEPLHIIGFDSAWLAGDDNDASKLHLTEDQVGRLMTDKGKPLAGWSIGLIHHPPGELADGDRARQLLADYRLGLLLHGHQHTGKIETWADPQRRLSVFAAGCLYESQHYPNGLTLIEIELREGMPLRPVRVQTRAWSANGHWHNHDGLYRNSRNGWLVLEADVTASYTPTPGKFIGRTTELAALCDAMLPAARGANAVPTLICCAIDGMPGVGKTRLAEEFIAEHWLKACPPPPDTPLGDCVMRLVLAAGEDAAQARDADTLLRDLGDRLRLQGSLDDIRRDLPAALRHGPGGHPRLVLIENVDSEAQAEQVVALVHRLPDCPVLVTARVRKFGGLAWKRVEVEPMRLQDAIDLLRNEAAAAGDDACVPTVAQAQRLAETLGRLPLALHIAASHLGLGKTPDEFLAELRSTGLDLAPAQQGDHGLQVDRARAILRSSFDLSWRTWCQGPGAQPEWQQALIALAHGPSADVGESLGTAITALPPTAYGPCVIAAGRLSLLEWDWAGEGDTRERRVRLHALIAEFLRTMPAPEPATVIARIGDWFAPRVSDGNPDTMGSARRQVQSEPAGLLYWLAASRLDEAALSIVQATHYARTNGPYGPWLDCFKAAMPHAGETQRGLDLAWAISLLAKQSGDPGLAMNTAWAYADLAKRLGNDYEYVIALGQVADIVQGLGELEEALRIRREEVLPVIERSNNVRSRAITQGQIADILQARGELEEALQIRREEVLPVFERLGDVRSHAITQGKIANILQARGELDEALRIRREEVLPVLERLGDVRDCALTQGQIADILQARGELEEALWIRREEVLPVLKRLGDVRSIAIMQGKIADILQARGELEEALRIRREEELPVVDRLGDVRSRAVAQSHIADILQARGELEEALRIHREETLPVVNHLGDVKGQAVTLGKIASILQARGELEEALRIRREEVLPVYERLGDVRELVVGRTNLAINLAQCGRVEDRPEILTLLHQALHDAERLRLPEAAAIRGYIAQIFGPEEPPPNA